VCASDFAVNASFLLPLSIPTAIVCVSLAEGSTFRRTQKIPLFQNGVAFFERIQLAARFAVVGINGFWLASTTGTYSMGGKPS
jgi:hypothetical protein